MIKNILCPLVLLIFFTEVFAQIKLASLFKDHAVLQENTKIPIWGQADVGENVTVIFMNQKKTDIADENGKWMIFLDPINESSSKGENLEISGRQNRIILSDILVGQVWLCSGQSNMGARLPGAVENSEEIIEKADHPNLRFFNVPSTPSKEPRFEVDGSWITCSPQTAPRISGTGYFFARELLQKRDKPIGLIISAWGGSTVEAWISSQTRQTGLLKTILPHDISGHYINMRPGYLYNGMLSPLIPYALKGVVWYQGESNAMDRFNPYLYRYLFKAMIEDWRTAWKREEMPFYFVQLPNLYGGKDWPILRESQAVVEKELANVRMVTTIDIGESRKLHPNNKDKVGKRLADMVFAYDSGLPTEYGYPEFESLEIAGKTAIIKLKTAMGLRTDDGKMPANFELAGQDGIFKSAAAEIEDCTIKVSNPDISNPVYVRYAWSADPKVNVINKHFLPLRPFRTDSFPVRESKMLPRELSVKAELIKTFGPCEIAKGNSNEWRYIGDKIDENVKPPMLKYFGENSVQLMTKESKTDMAAPSVLWEKQIETVEKGITFEVHAGISQANKPYRGFSIQAKIATDNQFRFYRFDFKPLYIFGYNQSTISTLAYNIDNFGAPLKYRMAIREDGVAQIYFKNQLVGLLEGFVKNDADKNSYIRFGILKDSGDVTVDLFEIAIDETGAFAPE